MRVQRGRLHGKEEHLRPYGRYGRANDLHGDDGHYGPGRLQTEEMQSECPVYCSPRTYTNSYTPPESLML